MIKVLNKFIIRTYWNYNLEGETIDTYTDYIVIYNKNEDFPVEITKLERNILTKSFNDRFYIEPKDYTNYSTLLTWNETIEEVDPVQEGNLLTFALDVKRNLYKFNNNVKLSSIKNLVSNYSTPDQPNNN